MTTISVGDAFSSAPLEFTASSSSSSFVQKPRTNGVRQTDGQRIIAARSTDRPDLRDDGRRGGGGGGGGDRAAPRYVAAPDGREEKYGRGNERNSYGYEELTPNSPTTNLQPKPSIFQKTLIAQAMRPSGDRLTDSRIGQPMDRQIEGQETRDERKSTIRSEEEAYNRHDPDSIDSWRKLYGAKDRSPIPERHSNSDYGRNLKNGYGPYAPSNAEAKVYINGGFQRDSYNEVYYRGPPDNQYYSEGEGRAPNYNGRRVERF